MPDLQSNMHVPPMTPAQVMQVRLIEDMARIVNPDDTLRTHHAFHAGMYARTIRIPAGEFITGALVRIPTLLIVDGDAIIWLGDHGRRIAGHHVLLAAAGRKQAFRAFSDTHLTMVFATGAKTVDEAEREFTDEFALLLSRRAGAANEIAEAGR